MNPPGDGGGQGLCTRRQFVAELRRAGLSSASYDKLRAWEEKGWATPVRRGSSTSTWDQTVWYRRADAPLVVQAVRASSPVASFAGERDARLLELFRDGKTIVDVVVSTRTEIDDVLAAHRRFVALSAHVDLVLDVADVARARELARTLGYELRSGAELVELLEGLVRHAQKCERMRPPPPPPTSRKRAR